MWWRSRTSDCKTTVVNSIFTRGNELFLCARSGNKVKRAAFIAGIQQAIKIGQKVCNGVS